MINKNALILLISKDYGDNQHIVQRMLSKMPHEKFNKIAADMLFTELRKGFYVN